MKRPALAFVVLTLCLQALCVSAQTAPPQTEPAKAGVVAAAVATPEPAKPPEPVVDRSPFAQSLLFSPLEILLIKKFLEGGDNPANADIEAIRSAPYIPPVRRIILSGIVYKGQDNWIVWLNNQKLTPGNLLPEVVSMSVKEDRIDLEWYDIGLNDVIKIKMRPHQIYDIVTGVLLPG
jgi:hypothetical protein